MQALKTFNVVYGTFVYVLSGWKSVLDDTKVRLHSVIEQNEPKKVFWSGEK